MEFRITLLEDVWWLARQPVQQPPIRLCWGPRGGWSAKRKSAAHVDGLVYGGRSAAQIEFLREVLLGRWRGPLPARASWHFHRPRRAGGGRVQRARGVGRTSSNCSSRSTMGFAFSRASQRSSEARRGVRRLFPAGTLPKLAPADVAGLRWPVIPSGADERSRGVLMRVCCLLPYTRSRVHELRFFGASAAADVAHLSTCGTLRPRRVEASARAILITSSTGRPAGPRDSSHPTPLAITSFARMAMSEAWPLAGTGAGGA